MFSNSNTNWGPQLNTIILNKLYNFQEKTPKVTINLRNLKLRLNNYHRQKQRVRLHLVDRSQARRRQNADHNGAYGR
jgi:hypothetical protein